MKVQQLPEADKQKVSIEMDLHEARIVRHFLGIQSQLSIEQVLKAHHGGMTVQAKEELDDIWEVVLLRLWSGLRRIV